MSDAMRKIRVEKVTLNIGVGEPGDRLDKAMKLLTTISGAKPVSVKTMKRIPSWGVRPKLKIATKVTLRGSHAEEVLSSLLAARDKNIPLRSFDLFGNFSFGIPEYIDIPGIKYDVEIGIIGLEVAVTLSRPGFRVKRRFSPTRVPQRHCISRDDAVAFIKERFGITVTGEEMAA